MTNEVSDLAPADAKWAPLPTQRRCWNCLYYSFKVYGGEDSSSGKCFRDHEKARKVYYVDGNMVCSGFKLDKDHTYDPHSVLA
jgi:hypothetical protein